MIKRQKKTTTHLARLRFDSGTCYLSLVLSSHPLRLCFPSIPLLRFPTQRDSIVDMASIGRMMRRLASRPRLDAILAEADSSPPIPAEAPQVNLPRVDTQLNMHQFNGFFEDGPTAADGLRGKLSSYIYHTLCADSSVPTQIPTAPRNSPHMPPPAPTRTPPRHLQNGPPSATQQPANQAGSSTTCRRTSPASRAR